MPGETGEMGDFGEMGECRDMGLAEFSLAEKWPGKKEKHGSWTTRAWEKCSQVIWHACSPAAKVQKG